MSLKRVHLEILRDFEFFSEYRPGQSKAEDERVVRLIELAVEEVIQYVNWEDDLEDYPVPLKACMLLLAVELYKNEDLDIPKVLEGCMSQKLLKPFIIEGDKDSQQNFLRATLTDYFKDISVESLEEEILSLVSNDDPATQILKDRAIVILLQLLRKRIPSVDFDSFVQKIEQIKYRSGGGISRA